jgi:hypothetical protein
MGGPDDDVNLVELTVKEHILAHKLLHLVYPDHKGLNLAVRFMTNNDWGHMKVRQKYSHTPSKFHTQLNSEIAKFGNTNPIKKVLWHELEQLLFSLHQNAGARNRLFYQKKTTTELVIEPSTPKTSRKGMKHNSHNPAMFHKRLNDQIRKECDITAHILRET